MRRSVRSSFVAAIAATVTLAGMLALPASAATPAPPIVGVLAQPSSTAGCVQDTGSGTDTVAGETCDPAHNLTGAGAEAVTPDGRFLYVGSTADGGSIAIFSRDLPTGRLTQVAGSAGCASVGGNGCTKIRHLTRVTGLVANNTTLFVANAGGTVMALSIDSGNGSLSSNGVAGCVVDTSSSERIQPPAVPDCQPASGIRAPSDIALSKDGTAVYVVSPGGSTSGGNVTGQFAAIDYSHDNMSGDSLSFGSCYQSGTTPPPGPTPPGACGATNGLDNAVAVTSSATENAAFVASFGPGDDTHGAVVEFDGAGSSAAPSHCFGNLTGCVSPTARHLGGATAVAVSPNGRQLYVAAQKVSASDGSFTGGTLVRIDRAATTNVLTQPAGTAGCISEGTPAAADCATGRGLTGIGSVVATAEQVYTASSLANFSAPATSPASGSSAISRFERAVDGSLAQPAGTDGCLAATNAEGCAVGHGLKGLARYPRSLILAPAAGQLYAAADQSRAVAEITRHESDLRLSAVPQPGPYAVGQNYNITLSVLNAGPAIAHNVTLTDVITLGGAVVAATPEQGSCVTNPTVCQLGTINPDQVVKVVVRITPTQNQTSTNTGTVGADEGDILPADNTTVTSITTGVPSIAVFGGAGQVAKINTAFAEPLRATVKDAAGQPLVGVQVTFAAPTSGPSALFGGATTETVLTDSKGGATSTIPVANNQLGTYDITVSSPGAAAVTASLTNNATGPSPSASPTATPTATITPGGRKALTLFLTSANPITPGVRSTWQGNGKPGDTVTLRCYSRTPENSAPGSPTPTYFDARNDTIGVNGVVSFSLNPGTNTRCFLKYAGAADSDVTTSNSVAQSVATSLSLSPYRDGVRRYHFQGTNLPRRAGQLITLYRYASGPHLDQYCVPSPESYSGVSGGSCVAIRTATAFTNSSNVWRIDRTFTGSGQFYFVARTSKTLTNVAGFSNQRLTIIH